MADKKERIILLQRQKAEIYPDLVILNAEYQKIRQEFHKKEQAYITLRKKYEALDREEKLLIFDKPKKIIIKKVGPTSKAKAKNAALKALDDLPPDIRAQILENFKKG